MSNLKYFIKFPMKIQEINITEFPLVIFTDTHTNLKNVQILREKFPNNDKICLGDFTSLWNKKDNFNNYSVEYFRKNFIPCLKGNHEEHIANYGLQNSKYEYRVLARFDENSSLFNNYNLTQEQLEYIDNLSMGFKINLPNGKHYLAFHNRPNDLWSFTNNPTKEEIFKIYPVNEDTLGIIIGHMHKPFNKKFINPIISFDIIGQLAKFGSYGLLTENGIEHKNL